MNLCFAVFTRVLEEVAEEDIDLGRNVLDQRRFIAVCVICSHPILCTQNHIVVYHHHSFTIVFQVEGLYRNYGDICNLPELLALKSKYKYRVILNEVR